MNTHARLAASLAVLTATGFLGGAIMARLIEGDQWDNTLFLVRAATPEEGLARLTAVLRRFEGASPCCKRDSWLFVRDVTTITYWPAVCM